MRDERGHPAMKTMMGWRAWRAGRGLFPTETATEGVTATPTPWFLSILNDFCFCGEMEGLADVGADLGQGAGIPPSITIF